MHWCGTCQLRTNSFAWYIFLSSNVARTLLHLLVQSSLRSALVRSSSSSSPLCDETAVAVSVTRETDGATDGGGGSATWLEVVGADDDMGRIGGGPIGFFSLPSSHLSHSYYRRQESGMPRPSSPRVSQLLLPSKTQDCHLKCFHGSNQRRNGKVLWAKH